MTDQEFPSLYKRTWVSVFTFTKVMYNKITAEKIMVTTLIT